MTHPLDLAFEQGQLLRPRSDHLNTVDLIRSVATWGGVPDLAPPATAASLADLLRPARNVVLILLDGLGINLLDTLPTSSFLIRHFHAELQAVCPATTASALTTLATGQWPAQHAIPGWWTYLPDAGIASTILPFIDRQTGQSLLTRGVRPEQAFPSPAFHPRLRVLPWALKPKAIVDTIYSRYSRGHTPAAGYTSIDEAFNLLVDHLRHAAQPTYTFVYVHDLDTLSHHVGWDHPSTHARLLELDAALAHLAERVPDGTRLLITADHGQINVPLPNRLTLYPDDPLLRLLLIPPTGGPRLPLFHVRPEHRDNFPKLFTHRFRDQFALFTTPEAEARHLFGPDPMTDLARRRFGDFTAIPLTHATLQYYSPGHTPATDDFGHHAGLAPGEVRIPLIAT